jgi:hypothetical protein
VKATLLVASPSVTAPILLGFKAFPSSSEILPTPNFTTFDGKLFASGLENDKLSILSFKEDIPV